MSGGGEIENWDKRLEELRKEFENAGLNLHCFTLQFPKDLKEPSLVLIIRVEVERGREGVFYRDVVYQDIVGFSPKEMAEWIKLDLPFFG